jgi:uncharacterized membrane protein
MPLFFQLIFSIFYFGLRIIIYPLFITIELIVNPNLVLIECVFTIFDTYTDVSTMINFYQQNQYWFAYLLLSSLIISGGYSAYW